MTSQIWAIRGWLEIQLEYLESETYHGAHYSFDLRFQDITGLSRTFFREFKDIFLQIPVQSRTHFIYLEKLQDIQGQQLI